MTRWSRPVLSAATALALAAPCAAQAVKAPPAGGADRGKAVIELPVKALIASAGAAAPAASEPFVNPKVEPGNVRWHASFDEACAASRRSGRPVLLFQMMGRLDEKFC